MDAQFAMLPTWMDIIPFDTEYAVASTPEIPIFVDVGGGNGHQCALLQKKFPSLKGRLVLQDRPAVLENAITDERVERMAYDYLTEQPVKGESRKFI
jgi:hypothetical protein